jgi:hypothetical protein
VADLFYGCWRKEPIGESSFTTISLLSSLSSCYSFLADSEKRVWG